MSLNLSYFVVYKSQYVSMHLNEYEILIACNELVIIIDRNNYIVCIILIFTISILFKIIYNYFDDLF